MSVGVDVVVYFESYYSILLDLELSAVHIYTVYQSSHCFIVHESSIAQRLCTLDTLQTVYDDACFL